MTHEPECDYEQTKDVCYCDMLRAAYQRGLDAGDARSYHAGYAQGRNDQARSRAYAEQVYGPYPRRVKGLADLADERMVEHWNQHGEGENP